MFTDKLTVACPGIRKGGGGAKNLKGFSFGGGGSIFQRGVGPAQKIAEKMIFP